MASIKPRRGATIADGLIEQFVSVVLVDSWCGVLAEGVKQTDGAGFVGELVNVTLVGSGR
jgi:hypothetical protein